MSLVLAVLFKSNWLQEDGAKLFFFASCFIALLMLARYASRKSETSYGPPTPQSQESERIELPQPEEQEQEEVGEQADSLPAVREVSFTLRSFQFKSFEAETGPEEPEAFCDEASVDINYRGGIMPWEFTIATPRGLQSRLAGKEWDFVFVREALIVPRYDLELIKASVLHQIKSQLESVPEEVAGDEMTDARAD